MDSENIVASAMPEGSEICIMQNLFCVLLVFLKENPFIMATILAFGSSFASAMDGKRHFFIIASYCNTGCEEI
jgi:hypothetical protein